MVASHHIPCAMTIGKKYVQRSKDHSLTRLIDQRTKTVLNAISTEPKGKALDAYLRSAMPANKTR